MARTRGIHHVGIAVAGLERSLAFYRDLLDMRVIEITDDEDISTIVGRPGTRVRAADLDAGNGQLLELIEYLSRDGEGPVPALGSPGSSHLSLRVDNLRSVLTRLASAGFEPLGVPVGLSSGTAWKGSTVVYLRDPDGFFVELIERDADD